jgi:hypothetical protein
LASEINRLAAGQGEPLVRWRAPWLPLLFGALMAALSLLPLLTFLRKLGRPRVRPVPA